MRETEINIPELNPRDDFAYSDLETKKTVYPSGVRPLTQEMLRDGFESGAFDKLSQDRQDLISRYFGTEISAKRIGRQIGVPKVTAFRRVRYALRDLYNALPEDVRAKYSKSEAILLKDPTAPRTGWHHSEKSRKKLGRKLNPAEIAHLRKIGKARMTQEEKDRLRDLALDKITPEERQRRSQRAKNQTNRKGHRFTSMEVRLINFRRFGKDPTTEERAADPLTGALFNLGYISGDSFPAELRKYYENNPQVRFIWSPPLAEILGLPYIEYSAGKLWYVLEHRDRRDEKVELTEKILREDPDNSKSFGKTRVSHILESLMLRMKSTSLFSRLPQKAQSQDSP